jgi:hypothetical protein
MPGCTHCPARLLACHARLHPPSGRSCFAATADSSADLRSVMNNIPAGLVLPGMRIHRRNRLPSVPTGRQGHPTGTPARRRCWRPRRRRDRGNARPGLGTAAVRGQTAAVQIMVGEITLGEPSADEPAVGEPAAGEPAVGEPAAGEPAVGEPAADELAAMQTTPGETAAAAMQLAIGLLTASLDSPALESWAVEALALHDADGLGNLIAGLQVVSELLLRELGEATGEPPEATLQRLAFLAERWRGSSSAS